MLLHATDACLLRLKARTQSLDGAFGDRHSLHARRQAYSLNARNVRVAAQCLEALVCKLYALLALRNALLCAGDLCVHLIRRGLVAA